MRTAAWKGEIESSFVFLLTIDNKAEKKLVV